MNKACKTIGLIFLFVALILVAQCFVARVGTLKGTFEYTHYEGVREHTYLYGIILLLGSVVTIIVSVFGNSLILRRIGYIGVAVQGIEVLAWEFADIYRGFYFGWEKINLAAYFAFPIAFIIYFFMAKRLALTGYMASLLCLAVMCLTKCFGSYETPAAIASIFLVISGIFLGLRAKQSKSVLE